MRGNMKLIMESWRKFKKPIPQLKMNQLNEMLRLKESPSMTGDTDIDDGLGQLVTQAVDRWAQAGGVKGGPPVTRAEAVEQLLDGNLDEIIDVLSQHVAPEKGHLMRDIDEKRLGVILHHLRGSASR